MRVIKLAALIAALVAATGSAARAAVDPGDFAVTVVPPVGGSATPGSSSCSPSPTGLDCTSAYTYTARGLSAHGTVVQRSTGGTGTIALTCDFDVQGTSRVQLASTGQITSISTDGAGSGHCSFALAIAGSALSGTLDGGISSSGANGSVTDTLTFAVTVVAGTGTFAGEVGTGTYVQTISISNPQPNGPPAGSGPASPPPGPTSPPPGPPPGPTITVPSGAPPPTAPPPRRLALAAQNGVAQLAVHLHRGQPLARIAEAPTVDAAHDAGLRIATAPHASCKAVATNGPKKIALGSARDANGDGTVVLVPKLTAKLGRGTWHVVAACGGANATATISVGA